jgi:hypothetical protein
MAATFLVFVVLGVGAIAFLVRFFIALAWSWATDILAESRGSVRLPGTTSRSEQRAVTKLMAGECSQLMSTEIAASSRL